MARNMSWRLICLPSSLLVTFAVTLFVCVVQSITEFGGSPCGSHVPCDVSVYGGYPKHGSSTTTFRVGLTLVAVQLIPMIHARSRRWPDDRVAGRVAVCGLAIISLLLMAYIPFWESPVHFLCAALTFIFLGVAQYMDASGTPGTPRWLKYVRLLLIFLTLFFFFGWINSPLVNDSDPISTMEYIAVFLPFVYFLTWTMEEITGRATVDPGEGILLSSDYAERG